MKRTFEEKLQAYEKGELTEEERKAFEKELDTLENIFENGEKQNNNNSFNKKKSRKSCGEENGKPGFRQLFSFLLYLLVFYLLA